MTLCHFIFMQWNPASISEELNKDQCLKNLGFESENTVDLQKGKMRESTIMHQTGEECGSWVFFGILMKTKFLYLLHSVSCLHEVPAPNPLSC